MSLQAQDRLLQSQASRLQALDPHQVLARGYAWVESAQGRPVTSTAALRTGQTVRGVWADGQADLEVSAVHRGRS